jgi:hypothetical protein
MKNTSKFYCQYLYRIDEHCSNRGESDDKDFCTFHAKKLTEKRIAENNEMLKLYRDGILSWDLLTPCETHGRKKG